MRIAVSFSRFVANFSCDGSGGQAVARVAFDGQGSAHRAASLSRTASVSFSAPIHSLILGCFRTRISSWTLSRVLLPCSLSSEPLPSLRSNTTNSVSFPSLEFSPRLTLSRRPDMAVFDALRHLSSYLYDAHVSSRHHLADLYELVQYAGNIVPRLCQSSHSIV